MPPEGMEELNKESVKRMLSVARSSPRLKEPRYTIYMIVPACMGTGGISLTVDVFKNYHTPLV
jgi:alpha-D-ribose 1-methylphosphonate 5-phosphate C-P lyase